MDVEKKRQTAARRNGSTGTWLMGALFGAMAGAVAGLMLAPQSGDETKRQIMERSELLRDDAERRLLEGRMSAERNVAQARDRLADWLEEGSSLLAQQADEVRP